MVVVKPDAPKFTVVTANIAYLQTTNTTLEDVIGIGLLDAFPANPDTNENSVDLLRASLTQAFLTKQKTELGARRYDIPIRGTNRWMERYWTSTNSPIVNENGEVECLVHITQDVTTAYHLAKKDKIAFDVAEAQRKQLYLAYQQAPVGIGLLSGRRLKIEFGNDSILQVLGKTNDIIGKTVAEAIPELKGQPFLEILDNVYTSGQTYYGSSMPARFQQHDELKQGFYNFIYHPLKNEEGETNGIMVIGIDVTRQVIARKELEGSIEQKNIVEQALRTNEARLQGILDTMAEGVSITDTEGNTIYTNEAVQKIVRLSKGMLRSRKYNDAKWRNTRLDGTLLPWEEHPIYLALKTKLPVYNYELGVELPNKEIIYLSLNASPLFNTEKSLTGAIATFTDVTSRRRLINELAESESRFRGMFEQAPLGMCLLRGKEQIIETVNDNILKIWGRKREEVIGLPQHIARPELSGQGMLKWLDEVFLTGKTRHNIDLKVNLYDGNGGIREAIVNSVYQPITDAAGNVIGVMMITDEITEEYRERQRAQHTQDMFTLAVESAELGTWYYDIETNRFVPSFRLKELYGFHADEEMSYEAALAQITDEYREAVVTTIRAAYNNEDGYDLEYPIINHLDKKIRWVKSTGRMYPAQDGKPAQFSGTVLNITERKLDDIRKNDFIAMVSHELKTPLTSMKASLQVLQLIEEKATPPGKDLIHKADQQINRMTSLINSFLNVSRLDAGKIHLEKSWFFINDLIREMIDDIALATKDYDIYLKPCQRIEVYADYEKTGQVINNFISNAIKYSDRGSRIELKCKRDEKEVIISVKDEGKGIAAHDKEHLFDRFYRVESKDNVTVSGFGIGLYICAEIVQRHGGAIGVESEVGRGSTFYFSIPLHSE